MPCCMAFCWVVGQVADGCMHLKLGEMRFPLLEQAESPVEGPASFLLNGAACESLSAALPVDQLPVF